MSGYFSGVFESAVQFSSGRMLRGRVGDGTRSTVRVNYQRWDVHDAGCMGNGEPACSQGVVAAARDRRADHPTRT